VAVAVVVLYNPSAGRGRGALAVDAVRESARLAGHESVALQAGPGLDGALKTALVGAAALVCVGGDGTLHYAIRDAAESGVPVCVVPFGTENLFARQFGMRGGKSLVDRLRGAEVQEVDLGRVQRGGEARLFAIMVSVGPDASVIHRLARVRRGPISHWSYVMPALQEAAAPALVPLRVEVDGRLVVDGRHGVLVVANSRQYAARIDPAAGASMTDGLLDVVFMPARTTLGVVVWAARARLGRMGGVVAARGRDVRITAAGGPSQVDGEALWADSGDLELSVASERLRVLV